MDDAILVVRGSALEQRIGARPFVALPREEIERHQAALEVLSVARARAAQDPELVPLVVEVVVHHNYSWFSFEAAAVDGGVARPSARRLAVPGPVAADDCERWFLDEQVEDDAWRALQALGLTRARCALRLAGLCVDGPRAAGGRRLGLVHVARLRQPGLDVHDPGIAAARFCGTQELLQDRAQFEPRSQVLIDHLQAL